MRFECLASIHKIRRDLESNVEISRSSVPGTNSLLSFEMVLVNKQTDCFRGCTAVQGRTPRFITVTPTMGPTSNWVRIMVAAVRCKLCPTRRCLSFFRLSILMLMRLNNVSSAVAPVLRSFDRYLQHFEEAAVHQKLAHCYVSK